MKIFMGFIILIMASTSLFAEDCGDVNGDSKLNLLDVSYTINHLYRSGPEPICWAKPILSTAEVSEITSMTAKCGGTIMSDGGATVTARGACWSTNPTPTVADNKTNDGAGGGSFTSFITGLTGNTPYYVRAFATNNAGTGYGMTMVFTTLPTVTDIDGNTYATIKIGDQWWMTENLKVTHYSNGEAIPNVIDGITWAGLATGAYCEYNNDVNNVTTYGRLYNWYAINDSRNIAPAGWHVPTDAEWQTLISYLGGEDVAGGKMKETGAMHWLDPTGATNESGFSALPGGCRYSDGNYGTMRSNAHFWSSTVYDSGNAWRRTLLYYYLGVTHFADDKRLGFSVRCVKD
jgi:uncharacterized protein (TIGR02145 family)